jgi:[ribosomal protein S18]-alanine N-acetyltransferase
VNARLQPEATLRGMGIADLDAVMAVECSAYRIPWSRGNFVDSLAAAYPAEVLEHPVHGLIGYYVAMTGVDEMHLLNLTVAPAHQRRGHARTLLDALERRCAALRLDNLWLEVRAGNQRAQQIYLKRGFVETGVRRGYYPAGLGGREDAIVMRLALDDDGDHALD